MAEGCFEGQIRLTESYGHPTQIEGCFIWLSMQIRRSSGTPADRLRWVIRPIMEARREASLLTRGRFSRLREAKTSRARRNVFPPASLLQCAG
jgi:hypothetical protein